MNRTSVLIILVLGQFACVSLWFAANAVMPDLVSTYSIQTSVGWLTSMVQLGFITGTLVFAVLGISDRYSPSKVFLISSLLGASFNAAILFTKDSAGLLYMMRFLTGFFLAGIYPTGMKIATDYFDKEISKALGYLLGALVIGTAFPLLLRSGFIHLAWQNAIVITSVLAVAGGAMVALFIPDGPFRKASSGFHPSVTLSMFKIPSFRKSVFGYFGHMWELYAFWAFVPTVTWYAVNQMNPGADSKYVMGLAFLIIAVGSLACIIGGYVALKMGSAKVALGALVSSGICCLLSPWILEMRSPVVYCFLLFWGMTVIMDSPQFSSLVSKYAPVENRGAALTIVNCIGFSITIFSIQLLDFLNNIMEVKWIFLFLFPGPLFGVVALWGLTSKKE